MSRKNILHLPSSSFKKNEAATNSASQSGSGSGSQDGILSGLNMSLAVLVLTVAAGDWSIDFITYHTDGDTVFNLDAGDGITYRVDVVYADVHSALHLLKGVPSARPVKPAIPLGSVEVGFVLLAPDGSGTVTQPGSGSPGGGAVSGLNPKQVLFGKSDGTIQQDSDFVFDPSTKSAYIGAGAAPPALGGSFVVIGDSFSNDVGASNHSHGYVNQLEVALGSVATVVARNGTTIGNPSRTDPLVDNLSLIPAKVAGNKFLLFVYGINDVAVNLGYTSADFSADYSTILTYALAHGWSASDIIVSNCPWFSPYVSSFTPTQTVDRFTAFNGVFSGLQTSFPGLRVYDIYSLFANNGNFNLQYTDRYHPNDLGHAAIALDLYYIIAGKGVYTAGQKLAVNGVSDFLNARLPVLDRMPDNSGYPVGRSADGSLKQMCSLPDKTRVAGQLIVDGGLKHNDALAPTGFPGGMKPEDSLFNYLSRLIWTFSNPDYDQSYWSLIEVDASMNLNLVTSKAALGGYVGLVDGDGNSTKTLTYLCSRNGAGVARFWLMGGNFLVDKDFEFRSTDESGVHFAGVRPVHSDSTLSIFNEFDGDIAFDTASAGAGTRTRNAKINKDGSYENINAGGGIVLKSPDGTRYRLSVANGGTAVFTSL